MPKEKNTNSKIKKITLFDIIDKKFLQSMQDFFSKTMGVSLINIYNSQWITDPSYSTSFCKYIIGSPKGYSSCESCHKKMEETAIETGNVVISKCHAGLTMFVLPIIIDGKYLGCTTGGQVLTEPMAEEHLKSLAEKFEINDKAYFEEARSLKVLSTEEMESITDLLVIFSNLLFSVYYANFQLAELGLDYRIPQNAALEDWFISKYEKTKKYISERETQVLKLVVLGKSNTEIAKELFISVHTAKAHVSSILEKFGVEDRVQLAVKAVRGKLL